MIKKLFRFFFSFSGRIGRLKFFLVVLIAPVVTGAIVGVVDYLCGPAISLPLNSLFSTTLFVSFLSFYVRRLHDMDYSGWWIVGLFLGGAVISATLYYVPYPWLYWTAVVLYLLSWVVFLLIPGTQGENRFG